VDVPSIRLCAVRVEIRCAELAAVQPHVNRRPAPLPPERAGDCVAAGNPALTVRASDLVRELPCLSIIRIGISVGT